jgi:hypothetical protein
LSPKKYHCSSGILASDLKPIQADAFPPSPQRTQMWAQVATEEEGVGTRSLAHNTWGVEGRVGALGWD